MSSNDDIFYDILDEVREVESDVCNLNDRMNEVIEKLQKFNELLFLNQTASQMKYTFGSCATYPPLARVGMDFPEPKMVEYERLMNKFCDRVEKGEILSHKTYAEFCEALGRENKENL